MSYIDNFKNSIRAILFNEQALNDVANDEKATGYGFLTLAIAGILSSLLTLSLLDIILSPILLLLDLLLVILSIMQLRNFYWVAKQQELNISGH
tara:strand:+ start:8146 stop:8427 length:282 start_codon:yes stop_codon:yes gene_type:complete